MEKNFHKEEMNYGVFTTSDIASILNHSTRTVSRYIKLYGDVRFGKVIFNDTYTWEVDGIRAVNFYAFIELAVFFLLRDKYGLSIREINEARNTVASTLQTPYPLATSPILTGGNKIFYEYLGEILRTDKKNKNQVTIKSIVKPLLDKIEFDDGNIAKRYYPLGKNAEVVIDPSHQFGQPTIKGTNIRTETLWKLYKKGETTEALQAQYELSAKQVGDAIDFYKQAA